MMRIFAALIAAFLLAGCGTGGGGDRTAGHTIGQYQSVVVFVSRVSHWEHDKFESAMVAAFEDRRISARGGRLLVSQYGSYDEAEWLRTVTGTLYDTILFVDLGVAGDPVAFDIETPLPVARQSAKPASHLSRNSVLIDLYRMPDTGSGGRTFGSPLASYTARLEDRRSELSADHFAEKLAEEIVANLIADGLF